MGKASQGVIRGGVMLEGILIGIVFGMFIMKFIAISYFKKLYPESKSCDSCEWHFSGTHHAE